MSGRRARPGRVVAASPRAHHAKPRPQDQPTRTQDLKPTGSSLRVPKCAFRFLIAESSRGSLDSPRSEALGDPLGVNAAQLGAAPSRWVMALSTRPGRPCWSRGYGPSESIRKGHNLVINIMGPPRHSVLMTECRSRSGRGAQLSDIDPLVSHTALRSQVRSLRSLIAVCDTSACTFPLKLHADVSQTAILSETNGARRPKPSRYHAGSCRPNSPWQAVTVCSLEMRTPPAVTAQSPKVAKHR